jgi:hypothetical protein
MIPYEVTVQVCHGDYRATFVGQGDTLEKAIAHAAIQSTYSSGIVPGTLEFFQFQNARAPMYQALLEALRVRSEYRGYGWCTFTNTSPDWAGHPNTPVSEDELARLIAEDESHR